MATITEDQVQKTINILTDLLVEAFPNIQVVFAIGNHDFEPANYQKFQDGEKTHHLDKINSWA